MTAFDPARFLTLATSLATSQDEAEIRVSLGRVYYAIFLLWRNAVGKQLNRHPHDVSHKEFRAYIKGVDPFAGGLVQSLWERRICADYRPANPAVARQRSMALVIDSTAAQASLAEASVLDNRLKAMGL